MDSLWYKDAVFYELNVRTFFDSSGDGHGDLRGLTQKLDYFQDLGVDCLWLLPINPSPLKDGGYDVSDYYGIMPEYGSLDDFKGLIEAAHTRGIRIIMDLVINHTSDQHPWFQSARMDPDSPYRDYYVWSDTDQKYQDARIIFLDFEKSNWTYDEAAGQYYWHRFYSHQPDLNFDNPAVWDEVLDVIKFWLDLGVDGFRVDAVPYLYEREGTNCENLPETHGYLKVLRRYVDEHYPGRILLCEANQWPEDVRPYFGDGDEFHMGFHFPVMPRIYMALRRADRSPLVEILERTPEIPPDCQWCTFLRNHDELTLEMVTQDERQWMWQEYAPDTRMRLNLGIRRRLAPLLDNDLRKIALLNSLLFTLPGSPIIYYGDELGMGDNIWLPDRDGVRTPMQWDDRINAGFSIANPGDLFLPLIEAPPYGPAHVNVAAQQSEPGSLWHRIRQMIAVRKRYSAFGRGNIEWLDLDAFAVAGYLRIFEDQRLLILNNLGDKPQEVILDPQGINVGALVDLFSGEPLQSAGRSLTLEAYQYRWLELR